MSAPPATLESGWKLQQAGRLAEAEAVFRGLLAESPANADAWCHLGMVCHDQQRYAEAEAAYRRALAVRPRFAVVLHNLANTLRRVGRVDEALGRLDEALAIDPGYARAHLQKGVALYCLGRLAEAEACQQRAIELDPDNAEAHKNLGAMRLLAARFAEGWPEFEWRWRTGELSLPACLATPRWDGSSLDGRSILLLGEQGLGDTVQFVRYARVLSGRWRCRVLLAADAGLLPLLAGVAGLAERVDIAARPLPAHDCHCPLMSLPGLLGENERDFPREVPYIEADAARRARWRERLAALPGIRVALAWQGNPAHPGDAQRSFPLAAMAPLARLAGVTLVSLQKGPAATQAEALSGRLDVQDLGPELDREGGAFMDTAAVLSEIDLLVSADTAVAHVAGALGVPTWLALAAVPDWRWMLQRPDSPWYPATRLFRRRLDGGWEAVFERMTTELAGGGRGVRYRRPSEYRLAAAGFNRLVAARHGPMLYNRNDRYIGRSLELYGEFSEGEVALFREVLREGATVLEAGANIGAHTVPIARRVGPRGRVHAFEPQRLAFQTLCANVALNGLANVHCHHAALGETPGSVLVPPLDPNAANNFGGLGVSGHAAGEPVPVRRVDDHGLERLDLLKADVEGMEREVLRGAAQTIARCRPLLYVENDRAPHSAALIEQIQSMGYLLYWHLPRLYDPRNHFRNPDNAFGGTLSVNMLCVHREVPSNIRGLRRVAGPDDSWRGA